MWSDVVRMDVLPEEIDMAKIEMLVRHRSHDTGKKPDDFGVATLELANRSPEVRFVEEEAENEMKG